MGTNFDFILNDRKSVKIQNHKHTQLQETMNFDFEDILTSNHLFAYVWYAFTDWEYCAAANSLKRLQKYRKFSKQKVEYILLIYDQPLDEKVGRTKIRYDAIGHVSHQFLSSFNVH